MNIRLRESGIELAALSAATALACMPWSYALTGALGSYSIAFFFLIFLPVSACSMALIHQLIKSRNDPYKPGWSSVWMGVFWLAVPSFIWLVSDVVLMTPVQRDGLFSTLFLATWILNLGLFVVSGMTVQRQWHRRSFWAIGVLAIFLLMIFAAGFDAFGSMEPVD